MSSVRTRIIAGMIGLAACATPAAAEAADGVATASGSLRAGPGNEYPSVGRVRSGRSLEIYGCTAGYRWCDVSNAEDRGWYPGSRIAIMRDGRRRVIPDVGATLGLSILRFGFSDYWQDHYRSRPFYNEPRNWRGRAPFPRDLERPSPRPDYRPDRPRTEQPRTEQPRFQPDRRPGQPEVRPPQEPRVERPVRPDPQQPAPKVTAPPRVERPDRTPGLSIDTGQGVQRPVTPPAATETPTKIVPQPQGQGTCPPGKSC